MARQEFYNQADHTLIVDGTALQDFDEGDDVISFEPQGDGATYTEGLDRNRISFRSPRVGMLTVRLKPTSPSIARLTELLQAQEQGAPRLFDVQLKTGVKDVLRLKNCAIVDSGFTTGGTKMAPREYQFIAENYELTES
jgi:hypothetical protein